MERKEVESSQLKSVGYDPATSTLEIEFKGGSVYQYLDVPFETHDEFMAAESMGRYFGLQIKGKFDFKKMPPPEKAEGAAS